MPHGWAQLHQQQARGTTSLPAPIVQPQRSVARNAYGSGGLGPRWAISGPETNQSPRSPVIQGREVGSFSTRATVRRPDKHQVRGIES